jgi:hypothetical protein
MAHLPPVRRRLTAIVRHSVFRFIVREEPVRHLAEKLQLSTLCLNLEIRWQMRALNQSGTKYNLKNLSQLQNYFTSFGTTNIQICISLL